MARGANKPGAAGGSRSTSKSVKDASNAEPTQSTNASRITLELQQKCLNIFRDALIPNDEDSTILQEVKGHLFNRDFVTAFGDPEYLRVYASRWSPSRALGYLQVFDDIANFLFKGPDTVQDQNTGRNLRVVSVGGGAGGELVALSGWLSSFQDEPGSVPFAKLDIALVDIADWGQVANKLEAKITTTPDLSKYASQARKDANRAMLQPSNLSIDFQLQDVLEMSESAVKELVRDAALVTFMFTMNELFSASITKTQQLLSHMTEAMCPGSCLLIVDSPGSYSTVSLNGKEKKYPMEWLFDHKLRGPPPGRVNDEEDSPWARLVSDDSRWFRLPEKLEYPIELENMRYQIHLYRRISASSTAAEPRDEG